MYMKDPMQGLKPKKQEGAVCTVAKKCGGCDYIGMDYRKQLAQKQTTVEKSISKFGKVHTIVGMEDPYHYRNKVSAAFGYERGKTISGVYEKYSHKIVNVNDCLIEDKKADEIIVTIRNMCKSFKIKTYDEDTGYGLLRHVLVRVGKQSGEVMVVLVTASPIFPSKNNFVNALREKHPEVTTVIQNINTRSDSMVLGDKEHVLYGKGYISDTLCGLKFKISAKSFYQVNPVQTEKLYNRAIVCAAFTGKETVLDAYCGVGTIGLIASSQVKEVIGVELNKDAVRDAVTNAKLNGITNADFYAQDAGVFIQGVAKENKKADVVIMDPPRNGSSPEFIDSVILMKPERVVYVSCNPKTLARDLELFTTQGYKMVEAYPFDCFPHTEHIECVTLLVKK